MRTGAILSGLFHLGVVVVLYVGVPDFAQPLPTNEVIPVEVVTIDEVTRKAAEQEPVEPEPAVEPELVEQETPPAPEPPEPVQQAGEQPPPAPTPEPEPAPAPPPEPRPEAKPAPPPEPEERTELVDEPQPPQPAQKPRVQLADKPEPKQRENRLASILNDVLSEKADSESEAPEPAEATPAQASDKAEPKARQRRQLSFTDRITLAALIRQQVERCWLVPIGAKNAEDLVVQLRVQLNPDGSLQRAEVVDGARMMSDAFYRTVAESALRAVRKCEPFQDLPPPKYDVWKDLKLTFNPEKYGT